MNKDKIIFFTIISMLFIFSWSISAYVGYALGKYYSMTKIQSQCSDLMSEQEQKNSIDCKKEISATIQACEDAINEVCRPEIKYSETL